MTNETSAHPEVLASLNALGTEAAALRAAIDARRNSPAAPAEAPGLGQLDTAIEAVLSAAVKHGCLREVLPQVTAVLDSQRLGGPEGELRGWVLGFVDGWQAARRPSPTTTTGAIDLAARPTSGENAA